MSRLFVVVHRLLSSCGMQVFSSLVVALGLCSLWHVGSLDEVRELSSCGTCAYLPHSMWDLSSLTRNRARVLCIGRWILYPGPPGKSPNPFTFNMIMDKIRFTSAILLFVFLIFLFCFSISAFFVLNRYFLVYRFNSLVSFILIFEPFSYFACEDYI